MSVLIVIGFRDPYRASEVMNELRRREWDWVVDLDQAVVVRWDERGRLRVQLNVDPTAHESVSWARMWGSLLSVSLLVPVTESMIDAAGDVAFASGTRTDTRDPSHRIMPNPRWWRDNLHLSNEFIRDVGAMVQPGDSAIFMLLQTSNLLVPLRHLRNYGGTLLHTALNQQQEDKLKAVLATGA
jgi:uncharacterized membrane protein